LLVVSTSSNGITGTRNNSSELTDKYCVVNGIRVCGMVQIQRGTSLFKYVTGRCKYAISA